MGSVVGETVPLEGHKGAKVQTADGVEGSNDKIKEFVSYLTKKGWRWGVGSKHRGIKTAFA